MNLQELLNQPDSYRYQMLGRMQADCKYSIDCGFICSHLWGITVENHIKYMIALWKSFDKNAKPKWLKLKEIKEYEVELYKLAPYSSETKMNEVVKKVSELTGFEFSKARYDDSLIYDMSYGCSYITNNGGKSLYFFLVDSEGRCFADFYDKDVNVFISKLSYILKSNNIKVRR